MKEIKIEDINLSNKKGIGWIVILGLIPYIGLVYILLFVMFSGGIFGVRLRRMPVFVISNNKRLGSAKFWGIIFLVLAIIYTVLLILFFDYTFSNILFPLSCLIMGFYLITYSVRYNNYIQYINSFLNNFMLKERQSDNFDFRVILKRKEKIDERLEFMLEDLKRNDIITLSKGKNSKEKIISFTPEFQEILLKKQ